MNASMISTAIISVLFLFLIFGFVFGWIRGFNKSITRFIMVLVSAVLAYFIVPPITKAVLGVNISSFKIEINGVLQTNVQDLVINLLKQLPYVGDLVGASDTFATFITAVPQMIINVVLFIVVFFLLKWFTMIIYWIIAGVCFNKKKMGDKDRHKFIGAVIGAVQGLIVFIVVFVPVFGFLQTLKPAVDIVKAETSETTESSQQNSMTETLGEVEKYYDAVQDTWVVKFCGAVGLKQLSVSMFDGLTTVKSKKTTYALRREVKTIAGAYPDLKFIMDHNFDIKNNDNLEAMRRLVETLYSSNVLSGTVREVVPYVANVWLGNKADEGITTFLGMNKPSFKEESIQELFDAVLTSLANPTSEDAIKNDLLCGIDLIKIVNDANLLESISGDKNIMDALKEADVEHLIAKIVDKALESDTLKAVLPKVVGVGMNYVYDSLHIDKSTIEKIPENIEVNWGNEKAILQRVFKNVFEIYDGVTNAPETDDKGPLFRLKFELVGEVFDDLRASQLLSHSSKDIMNALLSSKQIVGEGNAEILNKLVAELDKVWDDDVSLKPTFVSVGEALRIAKDMQDKTKDGLDLKDLGGLIEQLAEAKDGALGGVVDELVSESTLKDLGIDEKTAGVISDTIGEILDPNNYEGGERNLTPEIEAATELFDAANKVLGAEGDEPVELEDGKATDLVDKLAESNVVLDKLAENSNTVKDVLKQDKLGENTKQELEAAIEKQQDENVKQKLRDLFGLGAGA